MLTPVAGCLGVVLLFATAAADAFAAGEMPAATFSKRVRAESVSMTGVRIVGDVTLGSGVVPGLVCRDCLFDGNLIASGATFQRIVDLSGSDFAGEVDVSGARLAQGVRARGATFNGIVNLRGAQVGGDADMSKALFKGQVLSGMTPGSQGATTTFEADVDFSLASFSGLVTFEGTDFSQKVDFGLATFGTDAIFARGRSGHATFARTIFRGPADFSQFAFDGRATFDGAQFADHADFSATGFMGRAVFDRVRFRKDATFLGATFPKGKSGGSDDSFYGVQADGDLNFAFASFSRPAAFEYVVVTGTMSFSDATLPHASALHFFNVLPGSFDMNVDAALDAVRHDPPTDDRPEVLKLIESSAKAKDDLGAANDAHYARQVLKSEQYSPPLLQLDFIFYRMIAGYFVRPFRPLIVLVALASILTLGRMIRSRATSASAQDSRPTTPHSRRTVAGAAARATRGIGRAVLALGEFVTSLLTTLTLIGPARKGSEPQRQGRQIEIWTYRILFACALIGFANSNPTLREMFNAVR